MSTMSSVYRPGPQMVLEYKPCQFVLYHVVFRHTVSIGTGNHSWNVIGHVLQVHLHIESGSTVGSPHSTSLSLSLFLSFSFFWQGWLANLTLWKFLSNVIRGQRKPESNYSSGPIVILPMGLPSPSLPSVYSAPVHTCIHVEVSRCSAFVWRVCQLYGSE